MQTETQTQEPRYATGEVLDALLDLERPRTNWLQGLFVLGITMLVFVGVRKLSSDAASSIGWLVGVLFLHELGHYVAMRFFGFQDVRMFFVPFLGAAVSGRKLNANGTERAIVALAGPLPGLGLAFVLFAGAALGAYDSARVETPISMLLGINLFNLLPLAPFDGWLFMNAVLFDRMPRVEAAVRIVGSLGLIAMAIGWGEFFLGLFGAFVLMMTFHTLRVARIGREVGARLSPADRGTPSIPSHLREEIAAVVATRLVPPMRAPLKPKAFAALMHQVWQRAHQQAPSTIASVLLLGLYLGTLGFFALVVAFAAVAR